VPKGECPLKLPNVLGYDLLLALLLGVPGYAGVILSTTPVSPPPVTIRPNCTVDQDTAEASIDGSVTWNPPSSLHPYSLDFADRSPFAASSVAAGSKAKVTGTLVCNRLTVYALTKTRACYFPYTVSKDNGKPCADPGVRVVPPMVGVLFYLELVVLLGLGTLAVWRISARKRTSSLK
jgi:hypothetical protein